MKNTVDENRIVIASYAKPSFPTGQYHIQVTQNTKVQYDVKSYDEREYKQDMNLIVQFPRFSIAEKEIYEVYPKENAVGHFLNRLPYISFYKQTLPWIRSSLDQQPWIALFIFEETDNFQITHSQLKNFFLRSSEIAMMDSSVDKENGENEDDIIDYINISKDLFIKLTPTSQELTYLAHIKMMDFLNKSTNSEIPSQSISTLISNQYITEKSHQICLVSLEGMNTYLKDLKQLETFRYVRLPVLKQWKIYKSEKEIHFKERMSQLDVNSIGLVHSDKIIQKGFIPMKHIDRINSQMISWYHGPLINAQLSLKEHSHDDDYDQYLSFDPEKAMFDVSYSTAYQLGVMLAFSNKDIVSTLSQLRLQIQENKHLVHQNNILWKHRQKREDEVLCEIMRKLGDGYYE